LYDREKVQYALVIKPPPSTVKAPPAITGGAFFCNYTIYLCSKEKDFAIKDKFFVIPASPPPFFIWWRA
jgi:hypothetical protein